MHRSWHVELLDGWRDVIESPPNGCLASFVDQTQREGAKPRPMLPAARRTGRPQARR